MAHAMWIVWIFFFLPTQINAQDAIFFSSNAYTTQGTIANPYATGTSSLCYTDANLNATIPPVCRTPTTIPSIRLVLGGAPSPTGGAVSTWYPTSTNVYTYFAPINDYIRTKSPTVSTWSDPGIFTPTSAPDLDMTYPFYTPTPTPTTQIWSGSTPTGADSPTTCSAWTSSSPVVSGTYTTAGTANSGTSIGFSSAICSETKYVLCVCSATVPPTPYNVLLFTNTAYTTNGAIGAAAIANGTSSICYTSPTLQPSIPPTCITPSIRAMLSPSTASPVSTTPTYGNNLMVNPTFAPVRARVYTVYSNGTKTNSRSSVVPYYSQQQDGLFATPSPYPTDYNLPNSANYWFPITKAVNRYTITPVGSCSAWTLAVGSSVTFSTTFAPTSPVACSTTQQLLCMCLEDASTNSPSRSPSLNPTQPTFIPSKNPSKNPSRNPSRNPSKNPSRNPSRNPSHSPSRNPSLSPSNNPSRNPSISPTYTPSVIFYTNSTYLTTGLISNPFVSGPTSICVSEPSLVAYKSPFCLSGTERLFIGAAFANNPNTYETGSLNTLFYNGIVHTPMRISGSIYSNMFSVSDLLFKLVGTWWSGMASNGDGSFIACNSWTDETSGLQGIVGDNTTVAIAGVPTCDIPQRVICMCRGPFRPTIAPSSSPSHNPSLSPSKNPTFPTTSPSRNPSHNPSRNPSRNPSQNPSRNPSHNPSHNPSRNPSLSPSKNPSRNPSLNPSRNPSLSPSNNPSRNPSHNPSLSPSKNPSRNPSRSPSHNPSHVPSKNPSHNPSLNPSRSPSKNPSHNPSRSPSKDPSKNPSHNPSHNPSRNPSLNPSRNPSLNPTHIPSKNPSINPTLQPSTSPSLNPTLNPTLNPSLSPTFLPTLNPTQYCRFVLLGGSNFPPTPAPQNITGCRFVLV